MGLAKNFRHLPKRAEDMRRYLGLLLRDRDTGILSHMSLLRLCAGTRAEDAVKSVSNTERDAIVSAAGEIIRRRDTENPRAWARRAQKRKNLYKQGDPSVPSWDAFFGEGECPIPTDAEVQVQVTGSERRDDFLTVAAIKLADAYIEHRERLRRLPREREKAEKSAAIINAIKKAGRGKSATTAEAMVGRVNAAIAKYNERRHRRTTPSASRRTVPTLSLSSSSLRSQSAEHRWKTSDEDQKAGWMARAIYEDGGGLSITIKLSEQTVRHAADASKGLMSHLRERLAGLLKRRLGFIPDILLIGEQGEDQAAHIHGVIDLQDTTANRKAVTSAGEILSGKDLTKRGRPRIVDTQQLYDPERWVAEYLAKFREHTKRELGVCRVVVYSRSLAKRGKEIAARSCT